MAVLSRREDDGGFYTRINIGGIATRQVHPDAVRFLNKRGVYVGDEIPTEHMRKLRSTKHWLYTKEEFPYILFNEHRDPQFGMRPSGYVRRSVQGSTKVTSVGNGKPHKKKAKAVSRRPGTSQGPRLSNKQSLPRAVDPASWSEPVAARMHPATGLVSRPDQEARQLDYPTVLLSSDEAPTQPLDIGTQIFASEGKPSVQPGNEPTILDGLSILYRQFVYDRSVPIYLVLFVLLVLLLLGIALSLLIKSI